MLPDATTHSARPAHSGPRPDRWASPRHELSSWIDRRVLDVSGNRIGVIVDIYRDATTARPHMVGNRNRRFAPDDRRHSRSGAPRCWART